MSKNKIAQLRNANNLSQPQLAKMMGVSKQTIANWENYRREPDIDSLCRLSDIFNTTIDYILCNNLIGEQSFYDIRVCHIDECRGGDFICQGVPEAIIIARALQRMNIDQREKLLKICNAAFEDEFYDLIHHVSKSEEQGEL